KLPVMSRLPFSTMRMPVPSECPEMSRALYVPVPSPLTYTIFGWLEVPQHVLELTSLAHESPMLLMENGFAAVLLIEMSAFALMAFTKSVTAADVRLLSKAAVLSPVVVVAGLIRLLPSTEFCWLLACAVLVLATLTATTTAMM